MRSAAREIYDTDVIVRTLVKHFSKSSLRAMLMVERKGDLFDWCVKELYKDVSYDAIHGMTWNNDRTKKYLDAVQTIDANTDMHCGRSIATYQHETQRDADLCSIVAVDGVRLKCPNVRLITRHNPPQGHPRFTIILRPGKRTGKVWIHETRGVTSARRALPPIVEPDRRVFWPGWDLRLTRGLSFAPCLVLGNDEEQTLVNMLRNFERLDKSYTEINTGTVVVPLRLLGEIAESRNEDKKRITRFTAAVEPFSIEDLTAFISQCGNDLIQLDLCTGSEPNFMTPIDMPRLVTLLRRHCPRLRYLSLPLTSKINKTPITDRDIPPPQADISFSGGKLKVMNITLHRTDIKGVEIYEDKSRAARLFSFNFVRNIACIAHPGACDISIRDGDKIMASNLSAIFTKIITSYWLNSLDDFAGFFHRLGPIIESHFRPVSLAHTGLASLSQIDRLVYEVDGTPMTPEVKRAADERAKMASLKRKYIDMVSVSPVHKTWESEEACEADFQVYYRRIEHQRRLYEQCDRDEEMLQRWEDEREELQLQRWEDEREEREELQLQRWEDEREEREELEYQRWEDEREEREEMEYQRWEDEKEEREEMELQRLEDEKEEREEMELQKLEDEQYDREEAEQQRWEDEQNEPEAQEQHRMEDEMFDGKEAELHRRAEDSPGQGVKQRNDCPAVKDEHRQASSCPP